MSKRAVEIQFNGSLTTSTLPAYNSIKANFGSLIKIYTGATAIGNYIAPLNTGIGRPMEAATSIQSAFPYGVTFSPTIDWVFIADVSAAAATRRIILYEHNKNTSIFTWKGFVTLTYPTATAHTIRSLRMSYEQYNTGTITGTSTSIVGTGTNWTNNRMCVGSRIGFGTTAASGVTTWYTISAIPSNTSITLSAPLASPITSPSTYVIEDLRVITLTTNATVANGGLYVTKGLNYSDFSNGGTTIPAAVSTDNIKAVYWLADAAVATNTTGCGVAIQAKTSWTGQTAYVTDSTTAKIFVYNIRFPLTLASGKDSTTKFIRTGNQALTGTLSLTNNARLATLGHGPGSGVESLYFATTTRVYRAGLPITSGSTSWISDTMLEVPPGSSTTYAAGGALAYLEYIQPLDRLAVMSTGAAGIRNYITQYNTSSNPFDQIFLIDSKQQDQSTVDSDSQPHPNILATPFTFHEINGIAYMLRSGAAAASNILYSLPVGADAMGAPTSNQYLITPEISTANALKLYRVYINQAKYGLGANEHTIPTEPIIVYARTAGISDNSGSWTLLNDTGDLSSLAAGSTIQFRIFWKIFGGYSLPSRIFGLSVVYEDDSTDSHYEPSVTNSKITGNTFSWRQGTAWGSNIPNMRIKLYNAANNSLVLDDDVTSSSLGIWQYSTNNGSSWNTWLNSADTVGNYIRYVATSLPNNIRVRALLTQA